LTLGEIAARSAQTRGDVWGQALGGLIQQIGNLPLQAQQTQQALRKQALETQKTQAQIAADNALAASRIVETAKNQRDLDGQNALADAIKASVGEDGRVNHQAVADLVTRRGFPAVASTYLNAIQTTAKTRLDVEKLTQEVQQRRRDLVGEYALNAKAQLLRNPTDPLHARDLTLAHVAAAASDGLISEEDARQFLMQTAQAQPDQLLRVFDTFLTPAMREKEAAQRKASTLEVSPGATVYDVATGQATFTAPASAAQEETARHNQAMERIAALTAGRAEAAQHETARHNLEMERLRAAGQAQKAQGRPLLASQAQRFGEIDFGLRQAYDLSKQLEGKGAPGLASQVGAAVGGYVPGLTEYTGWGESALDRQATIDLTKQIIGKGLEGGVLRKEDEIKYAKILPKISDPPAVAKSKLDGLVKALEAKREEDIEAAKEAGYDVSRITAPPSADAPLQRPIPGITGGIAESRDGGKTWIRVK
jgi:hypothetical protein